MGWKVFVLWNGLEWGVFSAKIRGIFIGMNIPHKEILYAPKWNPTYTLYDRVDLGFPAHYSAYQIYLATKCSFQTQIEFKSSFKRHPAPNQTLESCGILWTPIFWIFTSVNLSVTELVPMSCQEVSDVDHTWQLLHPVRQNWFSISSLYRSPKYDL